jgi:hypothetical protein
VQLVWFTLEDGQRFVSLPREDGCLALLRPGHSPIVGELRLTGGDDRQFETLTWQTAWTLKGKVEDPEERPAPATITAEQPSGSDTGSDTEGSCRGMLSALGVTRAETGRDGSFELGPLPAGRWQLSAQAPGYAAVQHERVLGGPPGTIELPAFRLRPVATLVLEVDTSSLDDSPPFKLLLERQRRGAATPRETWQKERAVEIGDALSLSLTDLPPGFYRATLTKEASDLVHTQYIDLPHGATQLLRLSPAPIYLAGTVTQQGELVAGALVETALEGVSYMATTDENGTYHLRLWTPEHYAITARREGDSRPFLTSADLKGATPGAETRFDIQLPARSLYGTVVEREGRKPIPGCDVTLTQVSRDMLTDLVATTDSAGRFEFPYVLDDAQLRIEARADGYLPARQDVSAEAQQAIPLVLELDRGTVVSGRVVGAGGEAMPGATVGCCPQGVTGVLAAHTQTDTTGAFQLSVAEGATIFAVARGYSLAWAATGSASVIRLPPRGAQSQFRLRDRDGKPVAGARLLFGTLGGFLIPSRLLDAHAVFHGEYPLCDGEGRVAISGLPAGTYTVWLAAGAGVVTLGTFTLPASGPLELTLPTSSDAPH